MLRRPRPPVELVGIAIAVSLLLAAPAWWRPTRGVLVLAGVAAASAALDVATRPGRHGSLDRPPPGGLERCEG